MICAGLRSTQTTSFRRSQAWLPTLRFWKQLINGRSKKWALMRMINVQKWEIMHLRILVHGEVGKLQLMFLVGYAFGKAYELTHSAILCLLQCCFSAFGSDALQGSWSHL